MADYYEVLGVRSDADAGEIKKAFRHLILKHHPDRRGSAADFVKIREAYDVLSDTQRRTEYDLAKHVGSRPMLSMFSNMSREMGILSVFTDILSGHIQQWPRKAWLRNVPRPHENPASRSHTLFLYL